MIKGLIKSSGNKESVPKKGQIAVLLALSFSILALLAAMVINISFLVTAKINLQNATDLAAYAGAIQQARYLTEIGKWNYEMRRNYKAMVYDLAVVYNAERSATDFKKYINNGGSSSEDMIPVICATLQRNGSGNATTPANHELTCRDIPYKEFQKALTQSYIAAASASIAAVDAALSGSTTAAVLYAEQAVETVYNAAMLQSTANDYTAKYKNYNPNDKYNYNRRLIAWTLHAYRHLQTRIRGVHYGNISSSINDRFALQKNPQNMEVNFENSPIAVAAKVINGFTDVRDPTPGSSPVMELSGDALKNPVHNAAAQTFKNNLLDIIGREGVAHIFAIRPNKPGGESGSASIDMSGGCNERCNEYKGPYLRLQQHDLLFPLTYMTITELSGGGGIRKTQTTPINSFPVGVAKDSRVLTYYAVVGIANVSEVPFNVFFGGGKYSEAPLMVAVAVARPFGSRIGPFIDDNCNYSKFKAPQTAQAACIGNGLDPLYPKGQASPPNFSILDPINPNADKRKLGVKMTVDSVEHSKPTKGDMKTTTPNNNNKGSQTDLFAKTYGSKSRDRLYQRPGDNRKDDGFTLNPTESKYYENSSSPCPVPPQGNKNSIFAWPKKTGDVIPGFSADASKRKSFEAYLKYFGGKAISALGDDPARKINDEKYKIYVFKYPKYLTNDSWDIDTLTLKRSTNYQNNMEKSFANTMAVNEFEIKRYIIPYHTDTGNKQILNYITSTENKIPFIHAGSKNRGTTGPGGVDMQKGYGNKKILPEYITKEDNDYFDKPPGVQPFPEYYTAWRTGIRGYRVKLTNIQDVLKVSGILNPLPDSINIPDEGVTVNLKLIQY